MKIVLIGSGNVATVFGKLLRHAEHEIVQVISRNATNANELADALGAAWTV
ncbi:MAG: NAD(P)-binding domain-containing protein, partial [Ferruginibacter sp.]